MILCEPVLGNLSDEKFSGETYKIDYVEIEWHEAYKRIHQKMTQSRREIGVRLGTEILTKGLRQGDVLWQDGNEVIAVDVPPCEVIVIHVDAHHPKMAHKVCFEIGNKHGALMWGEEDNEFITPYNEPTFQLLAKLHGVTVEKAVRKLDFDRAISSTVSSHTH